MTENDREASTPMRGPNVISAGYSWRDARGNGGELAASRPCQSGALHL